MNIQPLLESSATQSRGIADALLAAIDKKAPLSQWIMPQTSVVWNGSPLEGPDNLAQMIAQTPATMHSITSFNCHPLPNNNSTVTVSGSARIGDPSAPPRTNNFAFTAFLVLSQIPNGPLAIQAMDYRLVHKPVDSILDH